MKSKPLTFSKLNIRKYLYHFEIGKNSYPKQKNETDEFKLHIKDTLNKVKLQATDLGKVFAVSVTDKRFVSKMQVQTKVGLQL